MGRKPDKRAALNPGGKRPTVFVAEFADDDAAASAQKALERLGGRLTVTTRDGVEVWTFRKGLDS
jgi:hypothetical protein